MRSAGERDRDRRHRQRRRGRQPQLHRATIAQGVLAQTMGDLRRIQRPGVGRERATQVVEQQQGPIEGAVQYRAQRFDTGRALLRGQQSFVQILTARQVLALARHAAFEVDQFQRGGQQRREHGQHRDVVRREIAVALVDGVKDAERAVVEDQRHGDGVVGIEQAHEALNETRVVLRIVGDARLARLKDARGIAAVGHAHAIARHHFLGLHAESRRLQHQLITVGIETHEAAATGVDGGAGLLDDRAQQAARGRRPSASAAPSAPSAAAPRSATGRAARAVGRRRGRGLGHGVKLPG